MLNNVLATIEPGDGVSQWAGQVQESGNYYFSNMAYSLLYALIGFAVVFIGIALLILIIWLVGYIFKKTESSAKKSTANEETVTVEEVPDSSAGESNMSDEIPDEIKAVIMAAIIGYYDKKEEKCEFTVRRIKRL